MLALLLSYQTQEATADRTLSTINRDGRMVAEMSRDRKYRVALLTAFCETNTSMIEDPMHDDFMIHAKTSTGCSTLNTRIKEFHIY